MTTNERLEELEKRVLNLEMKLQARLVKKNTSSNKSGKTPQKSRAGSKRNVRPS